MIYSKRALKEIYMCHTHEQSTDPPQGIKW